MSKRGFNKFDSDWLLEQEKKKQLRDKQMKEHQKRQEFKLKKIPDSNIGNSDLSKNKKIKNAVKSEVDGVKFDSNLERDFYFELVRLNIPFEFKHKFLLMEDFKYGDEKIRPVHWVPDFYFKDLHLVIDTKGFSTDMAKLKIKLFKNMVYQENICKFDSNNNPKYADVNKHITVLIVKNKNMFIHAILSLRGRQNGYISDCENVLGLKEKLKK